MKCLLKKFLSNNKFCAFLVAVMDARRSLLVFCRIAFAATVLVSEIPAAPPPPTAQDVRGAVERSLPYLEKVGTDWMREQK